MIDIQNRAYNLQFGHLFTSVIPTNIFGPFDNFNLDDSHVVPGLIHKAYIAKRDNAPLVISGSGKPFRQFIYSLDLARLIVWTLRCYPEISPIILSVSEHSEVTIEIVARMIAKAIDFHGKIIFDTSKSDGQFKKTASNAKLCKYVPEFQFTPLELGIQQTVNWFVENYAAARK